MKTIKCKYLNKINTIQHTCFLDLNHASNLLSSKIADIPHKLKYEIIIAPLFEYCFGTSDQNVVWEYLSEEVEELHKYVNSDIYDSVSNEDLSIIKLQIDWIRDGTFIYNQLFNLVSFVKLDTVAMKFGLWSNRKFVSSAIDNYKVSLHCVDRNFLNDKEIVMAAVKEDGYNLDVISDELRNDRQVVIQAVKSDGFVFSRASKTFQDDEEILLIALESNPITYQYSSDRLRNERSIILKAVSLNADSLRYASDELKKDREIVKMAIMKDGKYLKHTSIEIQNDLEIVELALKSSPDAFHYISETFKRDNIELITKLIGKRGFKKLPSEFSHDREIVLESIKLCSKNLSKSSNELQNDRDFILLVVKTCGMALEYVKNFQNDREIVMTAITQNGNALAFAPNRLFDDEEIILKSIETATCMDDLCSRLSERLKNNNELYMKCVCVDPLPRKLQLESEIMMQILKKRPFHLINYAYSFVSRNRTLAMKIVKQDGSLLKYLPSKYRNDREIVSFAIQQNKEAFKDASDQLKNDVQILKLYNP